MSTVGGYLECCGGYHDARGGVQYCSGKDLLLFEYPHGTEQPHGTHDIPHMYHDIPHGTEHPPRYSRYPATCIMISPHGTADTRYTGGSYNQNHTIK